MPEGTDTTRLAPLLGFLNKFSPAPATWQVPALPGRGVPLSRFAGDSVDEARAFRDLPPLVKGYLRLGAYVCAEAVIDWQFGTTDVFLVLPVERISSRYINYYGPDASRHAA